MIVFDHKTAPETAQTFEITDQPQNRPPVDCSNIQRVNNIPLKIIKIDKSMLNEAATDNGKIILDHTVRMMKSIGKELVAEGAETAGDVTMLKNMNCDYIQGFYFSKPLPAAEFVSFLKQNQK